MTWMVSFALLHVRIPSKLPQKKALALPDRSDEGRS